MSSRTKVMVAQIGARRHYLVPRALEKSGLLELFVTDACVNIAPWRWFDNAVATRLAPQSMRRLIGRRVDSISEKKIRGFPLFALTAALDRDLCETATIRWARRNAEFARRVAGAGFGNANTVYAFNGAALEIFESARSRGIRTILDQTAAPWRWNRNILLEEHRRWPGWEENPAEIDLLGALQEREEQEWKLADRIVCGSRFAAEALAEIGGPREKCVALPYPIQTSRACSQPVRERHQKGRKMRVLFVGTLQLRKGVQYLAEALRQLPSELFEARFVGQNRLSGRATRELARDFETVGLVPRSEIATHYQWADIFVLPTLSEGSANVCYEAMAAGLPIITTENAGSTIENEKHGLIVPVRDADALGSAIRRLIEDEELRRGLVRGAARHAAASTLQDYATAIAQVVTTGLCPENA